MTLPARGSFVLYDDARARDFEPFATTRPQGEMRNGAFLCRERWELVLNETAGAFVAAPHLSSFGEFDAPPYAHDDMHAGAWVVNTRALPFTGVDAHLVNGAQTLRIDGRVAAVRLPRTMSVSAFESGEVDLDTLGAEAGRDASLAGLWIDEIWDHVAHLAALLNEDIPREARRLQCRRVDNTSHPHVHVTGSHPVWIESNAEIEPFTAFDTSAGPILVRRNAHVLAFTRIVGPCFIGENSTVMGDRIATCSIGETARVHGEVSNTIFLGYTNKGHDGFVGHSILGRWVNLGAGTITSNLKNTYGAVSLWTPAGIRWTGQQFLGTLFGDHVKTGIGLRLTTGCVLGAGSNVYDAMPPKMVPPFRWGSAGAYDLFAADKFVATASRMMQRRHVTLDDTQREHLLRVHDHAGRDARWSRA